MKAFKDQNYYEVLGLSPNALPLEIRRAYKKTFALYQGDSIASYSFFSDEERQEILSRIEQAYLTLINPENRTAYDHDLIASGLMEEEDAFRDRTREPIAIYDFQKTCLKGPPPADRAGKLKSRAEQSSVIRDLLSRDTLAGSDLQKLRTALDVPLEEIANRTNIRIDILRAIEAENVELFPPLVYLKGFLRSYIRYLGLDEHVVLGAYLKKVGY
jgi:curved DNA-binding protein CbpA